MVTSAIIISRLLLSRLLTSLFRHPVMISSYFAFGQLSMFNCSLIYYMWKASRTGSIEHRACVSSGVHLFRRGATYAILTGVSQQKRRSATIDFPRNRISRSSRSPRSPVAHEPARRFTSHQLFSGYGIALIPQSIAARKNRKARVISCNPGETRQSHPTSAFIRGSVA